MAKTGYSLNQSLLICLWVYLIAATGAAALLYFLDGRYNPLVLALFADILATVIVFIFSVIFKNASLYDPYWSVAPPLIAWYWMLKFSSHWWPTWLMLSVI